MIPELQNYLKKESGENTERTIIIDGKEFKLNEQLDEAYYLLAKNAQCIY